MNSKFRNYPNFIFSSNNLDFHGRVHQTDTLYRKASTGRQTWLRVIPSSLFAVCWKRIFCVHINIFNKTLCVTNTYTKHLVYYAAHEQSHFSNKLKNITNLKKKTIILLVNTGLIIWTFSTWIKDRLVLKHPV